MAEKVLKLGVDRGGGFLYFIDKDGDVAKVAMARGGKKGGKASGVTRRRKKAMKTLAVELMFFLLNSHYYDKYFLILHIYPFELFFCLFHLLFY